jgi:hypothetical protein
VKLGKIFESASSECINEKNSYLLVLASSFFISSSILSLGIIANSSESIISFKSVNVSYAT